MIRSIRLETNEEVSHALERYNELNSVLNDYRADCPLENIDGVVNFVLACIRQLESILVRDFADVSESEKKDADIAVNQAKRDIDDNLESYEKFMRGHPVIESVLF